jgi:hypothetical protein
MNSGIVYLTFEVASLTLMLIMVEKILTNMMLKDYGNQYLTFLISILSWIFHCVGVIIWINQTGVKFATDCGTGEELEICGLASWKVALSNVFLSFLNSLFTIYVFKKYNKNRYESIEVFTNTCMKIRTTKWLIAILSLVGILVAVMVVSVLAGDWVGTHGEGDAEVWSGDLWRCDDCLADK